MDPVPMGIDSIPTGLDAGFQWRELPMPGTHLPPLCSVLVLT